MRTARGLLKLNRHTVALWYLKMLYVMLYTSCSSLHVLLEATPLEVDGDYVRRVEAMLDGEHSFNAIQLHRARGWNREVVVECEELSLTRIPNGDVIAKPAGSRSLKMASWAKERSARRKHGYVATRHLTVPSRIFNKRSMVDLGWSPRETSSKYGGSNGDEGCSLRLMCPCRANMPTRSADASLHASMSNTSRFGAHPPSRARLT